MRVPFTEYPFVELPAIVQTVMIYYPIIAAIGVPANLVTIAILGQGKCGLSKCVTRYLMAMAVADLLVILNYIILTRIKAFYFPTNFLFITPVCSIQSALNHASTDISVWLTVGFTLDRFVAICCQKLKTKYCSERTATAIIGLICPFFCLKNIPWYFAYESIIRKDNVPWGCNRKRDYYTVNAWIAYNWIHRCSAPLLPIFLILLLNALTVSHILASSKARQRLRTNRDLQNQNDPEMENRRRSVILLFAISGNFILLWVSYVIYFLLIRVTHHYYSRGFHDPMYILDQTSHMLLLLSCCTNTCIYAVTQRKFREQLINGVRYPLKAMSQLIRK